MSNYQIESHELLYLENKRKSKTNSFYVLKFTKQNKINLLNKKINITKKNNSIELNNEDKKILQEHNENIKQSLEKYIIDKEFDVKNNIEKIMFNDLFNNNKINFNISNSINTLQIQKNNKYDCNFLVKRIILIFTKPRVCEVSVILQLSSLGIEEIENESHDNDTTLDMSDLSESIDIKSHDNDITLDMSDLSESIDIKSNNEDKSKSINDIKSKKNKINVDTLVEEETKVVKKRGRPKKI